MIGDAEQARQWLERQGVRQTAEGGWEGRSPSGAPMVQSANEVAHLWAEEVLSGDELGPLEQLDLAFGLLDLLDEWWVTVEIRWHVEHYGTPALQRLWQGYRERLERPEPSEPVSYSLWVEWFEDRASVESAFREVLAADVLALADQGQLSQFSSGALYRRAERVLEVSGPVPWTLKQPVYEHFVSVPELHPALFKGILLSYHDSFGSLEAEPALHLLDRLVLPERPEHYDRLRAVLVAGHTKHHLNPDAWNASIEQER